MHGATTISAFVRDVPRGAGVAIPTSAFPFGDMALKTPASMASCSWRQSNWQLTCRCSFLAIAGRATAVSEKRNYGWRQ